MAPSWMQLLIVLIVALLLFGGRGRISSIMSDMAKGVRSFRSGLNDDDEEGKDKDESKKSHHLSDDKMVNVTPEKDKSKTSS
ncbi:MAG: Sec-independent protein translocase TatA [Henriciella sp.]|uniref:twin-arginine translocase TatA/TatE family subunit n=1 Tax=Henriciella sp. TaxID=1968823 RepID=UPI000C0DC12C|nr:twin-arginine translocase TatA/TatE family subunit [Henriciella sp.]MAN73191.1 Sec-independent protein translocase TatA [Henriciella sp.]MBF35464.1 Sec-independent protein translocase TatA [Hyphomonadaceae bacterium]MBK75432.1 Sec-independent protein translocase TatA [Henriciella sp.]PHR77416.1 MAG: Sec-independent protein translocase TatA [Henriciella sp.]